MTSLAVVFDLIGRDGASPAFNRAAASADRLAAANTRVASSFERTTAGMAALGSKLTKGLTIPLVAAAAGAVDVATKFNSAMTRIQTQAGASAKDVKTLSTQVLALSKTAQQGPVDLANALYHLKSVGLDNVQAMKALKTSSDLAAVGNANLEDTTNALAGAWRTGIRGAKNFHDAAATVNAVIGAGNMTLADFNDALGTGILASAKTFGLTLKDVGSALALFTDEGVPANSAATRLRMSFSLLGAPSNVAIKQLATIGISQFQLGNDLRKPNGLITAIGDLKQHLDDSGLSLTKQAALLSHAFGGGRSSSAILSLINNFSVLKQKQDQVTNSLGKYDKAVAAQKATPAAQFHELVANLEQAAVKLGNEILPDVVSLAHGLTGLVQGFNALNHATHGWLVTGAGIALLAGPVLALTAKLARGVTVLYRFAAGARQVAIAETAMGTASYSAGLKAGNFFATYGKGLGIIAAVGVAGYEAGKHLSNFIEHGNSGAKIIDNFNGSVNDLTASIINNRTQMDSVRDSWVKSQLDASGLTTKLGLAGITTDQVTAAFKNGQPAVNNLIASWKAMGKPAEDSIGALLLIENGFNKATGAALSTTSATHGFDGGIQSLGKSVKATASATKTDATSTKGLDSAMRAATLSGKSLSKAIENLGGKQLTTAQAQITMQQGLEQLRQSWSKNSDAILGNTKAAVNNRDLILQQVGNIKAYADTVDHGKDATLKANAAIQSGLGALKAQALAAGASKSQWAALVKQMHLTPHDIRTTLHVNAAEAQAALRATMTLLNGLHDKTIYVYTRNAGSGSRQTSPSSRASGGGAPEGWFWTGERGPELNYKSGSHTEIFSAQHSKQMAGLMGMKVPGFANGTGRITTGTVSGKKVWYFGGIGYSSLLAAENAKARAEKSNQTFHVGGTSYQSLHAAMNAAHRLLKEDIKLDVHVEDHDLVKFRRSLSGTVDQARSAFEALFGDARKAGVFQRYPNLDELLKRQNHTLDQAIRERTKLSAQLKAVQSKMKAIVSSTSSAAAAAFDITSAGANPATGAVTGKGLEAQQRQAVAEIREWAHDLDRLRHRGLNGTYLQQLAGAGPSSLPQLKALLSLPSLRQINRTERRIEHIGRREGHRVANRIYGERERTLAADKRDEKQFIKSLGHEMAHELKHAIETVKEHETIVVKVDGKDLLSVTRKHARKGKRRDGNRPHTP